MGWLGDAWDWAKDHPLTVLGGPGGYVLEKAMSDDPARSGGQYEGVDRNNFNVPGYDEQQGRLNGYLARNDSRGAPQLGQASAFRGGQSQLADMLMRRANGQDSVAEMQARQGMDSVNAQQRSFMAGARPANAAMAMQLGQQNMANAAIGLQGQAAIARAQEAQGAAGLLGSVLNQGRTADELRTSQQAQMNQQQMALNDAARAGLLGQSIGLAGMQQQGGMGYEQNRTQRYGATMGTPTEGEVWRSGIASLAPAFVGGG